MNKKKGSILILVIIFNLIISLSGIAFIYMAGTDRITINSDINKTRALYLAEAGIERAMNWFGNLTSDPAGITPFDPFVADETGGVVILEPGPVSNIGSYVVSVDPDDDNPTKIEKKYFIISTGTAANISKTVTTEITVTNFSRFAFFSDQEMPTGDDSGAEGKAWNERIYFTGADNFSGPVHSNDEISIIGEPAFSVSSGTLQITTAKDFYYFDARTNRAGGGVGSPLDLPIAQYPKTDYVDMYKGFNLNRLKTIAQDGAAGHFYDDSEKNYVQIYNTYIIVGNNWNSGTMYNIPASGGVLFCEDDVNVRSFPLGPTIFMGFQRPLTIVSAKKIEIEGSIKYDSFTPGMLGLVAGDDIFLSEKIPTAQYDLEVDAIIMTFESFRAEDYATRFKPPSDPKKPKPPQGVLTIFGGLIQRVRRPVGFAYSSSFATELKSGYRKDYRYDNRVLTNPPPYFPVSTKVKPIIWKEKPSIKI